MAFVTVDLVFSSAVLNYFLFFSFKNKKMKESEILNLKMKESEILYKMIYVKIKFLMYF